MGRRKIHYVANTYFIVTNKKFFKIQRREFKQYVITLLNNWKNTLDKASLKK